MENSEVEKIVKNKFYIENAKMDIEYAQNEIYESVMGFGDFSRYTIGTNHNLSEWSGYQKNQTPIDREKLFDDFKSHLSSKQQKLLDQLDPIISEESDEEFDFGDSKIRFNVAVGRKSEEELNKIRADFKKSLSQEKLKYYEEEVEPYLDHNHNIINTGFHFDLRITQRLIFSRVISLGWNPEIHGNFDDEIGTGRGRSTYPHERIGKKYQWIAFHEVLGRIADNFVYRGAWRDTFEPYQGTWQMCERDIDPSCLLHKTPIDSSAKKPWWISAVYKHWRPSLNHTQWTKVKNDLPTQKNLIEIKSKGGWLLLDGYVRWEQPPVPGEEKFDKIRRDVWYILRSYIVT